MKELECADEAEDYDDGGDVPSSQLVRDDATKPVDQNVQRRSVARWIKRTYVLERRGTILSTVAQLRLGTPLWL